MSLISASNLPRITVCPPSAFLPKDPYTPSKSAAKGTNIHKFVSDCVMMGEQEARKVVPARFNGKAVIERIQISEVLAGLKDIQTEIAVRWDAITDECSVLGQNIGRSYFQHGAKDWDIVGSIDFVAYTEDGTLVVADVKTGIQEIDAVSSEQLQALAYISSQLFANNGTVQTRIIKIRDDGSVHINSHNITPSELSILKLKFQGLRLKVLDNMERYKAQQSLDLFESDSCTWCPCKKACPAKQPAFNPPTLCQSAVASVEAR